jgi:hypothetical protein
VALVTKTATDESLAIACTLGSQPMRGRLEEWKALLANVTRRDDIDGGLRVTFGPATPLEELIRLTAAEQDCCQFFHFAITVDRRGVALEVRAPADAQIVVHALFGSPA